MLFSRGAEGANRKTDLAMQSSPTSASIPGSALLRASETLLKLQEDWRILCARRYKWYLVWGDDSQPRQL